MWLVSVSRIGVAKILLLPLCVQLLGVFISGGKMPVFLFCRLVQKHYSAGERNYDARCLQIIA